MDLLKKSAKHRAELENEVKLISERTQNIITNVLIIGGTLAATYMIVRQFSGRSSKKRGRVQKISLSPSARNRDIDLEEEEASSPGVVSQIGTALVSQATIFLLGLAKEKLAEYLQSPVEKKAAENERP